MLQLNAKDITIFLAFDNDDTAKETFNWAYSTYHKYFHSMIMLYGNKTLGPGGNRNRILKAVYDETYGVFDYISFMDHDDSLWTIQTLNSLIRPLEEDTKLAAANGSLIEETTAGLVEIGNNHQTWTHGKVFRVLFLKEWDIWFPETTNEDMGFSNLVTSFCHNYQCYLSDAVYLWRNRNTSLTRSNSSYLRESWTGFIETKCICYDKILEKLGAEAARKYLLASLPHIYYLSSSFDEYVKDHLRAKTEFLVAKYVFLCGAEAAITGVDGEDWKQAALANLHSDEAMGLAFSHNPTLPYEEWIHLYTNYKPFLEALNTNA